MRKDATLSPCGAYRYDLSRIWSDSDFVKNGAVVFVMLNPSTADADVDDPTIRRCIGFAKSWGYGGLAVVNLFALRETSPAEMKKHGPLAVGPGNDYWIDLYASQAERYRHPIVCAWGADGDHLGRDKEVLEIIRRYTMPMCLGQTAKGHPKHPLYLKKDTRMEALEA